MSRALLLMRLLWWQQIADSYAIRDHICGRTRHLQQAFQSICLWCLRCYKGLSNQNSRLLSRRLLLHHLLMLLARHLYLGGQSVVKITKPVQHHFLTFVDDVRLLGRILAVVSRSTANALDNPVAIE